MRTLMLVGGFSLLGLVCAVAWFDEGEVGILAPAELSGPRAETRLWVVEVDGATYVRAASPDAPWLNGLVRGPMRLHRGDTAMLVQAVPVDDAWTRRAVDDAMRRKYGVLDWAYERLHGAGHAIPVRLEPITATAAPR